MLPTIARNEEGAWLRSRSRSNRDDADPEVEVNIASPRFQEVRYNISKLALLLAPIKVYSIIENQLIILFNI